MAPISYSGYHFPRDVIQRAVWMYLRFTLSLRDVEDLLAERGIVVSYETIRRWVASFGPAIARRLRAGRPAPHPRWHLDEMFVRIGGRQMYLWRAVDAEGEVLDVHELDSFEQNAITALRANPKETVVQVSGSFLDRHVRATAPVVMGQVCVTCHNTHPDSPKKDWKVGDVRGIQEISVFQPIAANVLSFKYLLFYFGLAAAAGLTFILLQRRQAALIRGINRELTEANDFLAAISRKIAKYLSPQVYKGIFSGQKDVAIATERKKLTIFFSDIKDFTAISERLQPEDLTALLNEYFTEMSTIALKQGGTVDKFIGDAILVFFGDPESKGIEEDARACLRMAVEMQRRLQQLDEQWRQRGIEQPFRARIGINTGYCNVGNFGSDDRMDYTIIGAEANLAARLQAIAQPGGICLSYETYALVRDLVRGRPLAPIQMKGISREVVPYAVEGLLGDLAQRANVISEHATGLDLFVDLEALDDEGAERAKRRLAEALLALTVRSNRGTLLPTAV